MCVSERSLKKPSVFHHCYFLEKTPENLSRVIGQRVGKSCEAVLGGLLPSKIRGLKISGQRGSIEGAISEREASKVPKKVLELHRLGGHSVF